jgi:Domain of unknown function (DUF3844)
MIRQAIQDLIATDASIISLVFLPTSQSKSRQSSQSAWGPKLQRRSESEAPLSSPNDPKTQPEAHVYTVSAAQLQSNAIPARYSSEESCNRSTHNCSGHGECKILLSETEGDRKIESWGCQCGSSVKENSDGSKKTTYYAGNACQKISLVGPFWLLAGTTIFLVTVLSMGLGMLYSMGNDELPSVIGAGVTGPRAK